MTTILIYYFIIQGVFIVAAKRTPFGKMGGFFTNKSITELSVVASNAAMQSAGLKPEHIDNVIFGNVLPVSDSRPN